ncbi:tubulin-tyrosine ligase family-domain-containing protein, partial [Baffinella frigidus]
DQLRDDVGHKWSLRAVLAWMEERGINPAPVMKRIEDLVVRTLLAVEVQINTNMQLHVPHRTNCFELFGFDVMLDANLKPWLIEVNTALSLAADAPLDKAIKNQIVTELLHMVCVKPYDRRRLAEKLQKDKDKRLQGGARKGGAQGSSSRGRSQRDNARRRDVIAGRVHALEALTADDVALLRESDEELSRRGGYRRIFPNDDSASRSQAECFEVARYHNRLLMAWISRGNSLSVSGLTP